MVYFIYTSRFQGHLNYFHSIVAKLCTTDHQSCQEPETQKIGGGAFKAPPDRIGAETAVYWKNHFSNYFEELVTNVFFSYNYSTNKNS